MKLQALVNRSGQPTGFKKRTVETDPPYEKVEIVRGSKIWQFWRRIDGQPISYHRQTVKTGLFSTKNVCVGAQPYSHTKPPMPPSGGKQLFFFVLILCSVSILLAVLIRFSN